MNTQPHFRLFFVLSLMAFAVMPQARAAIVTASFASATQVPLTSEGYTATGNSVDISLSYAPAIGTTLTVVNNTGPGLITGTFSNLAQGQSVLLPFGGKTYSFVASYYGGSGNDLVLQWADTRVVAWGYNTNGQLGRNSNTSSPVPMAVATYGVLMGRTVTAICAGYAHSLALCDDGTLATWGYGNDGELGIGYSTSRPVPMGVSTTGVLAGRKPVAVSAGHYHNLVLCSDGTLVSWGFNSNGQLGNNSTATLSQVPVAVTATGVLAGKTVVAIATGASHSLALCSDGTMATWGVNDNGELGTNSTAQSRVPVAVTATGVLAGKTVVSIAAGGAHNLALCSDGTLAAWGGNFSGQLGNGNTVNGQVPVLVNVAGALAGKTVTAISAGYSHSLALCSDGTVAAWGHNVYGELGNDSTVNSSVPVLVSATGALAGKTVTAVSARTFYSQALCSDGTMAAWGNNVHGELGSSGSGQSQAPVLMSTASLAMGERFIGLAPGPAASHSLVFVAQAPLSDALLSGLGTSTGSLAPALANETTDYVVSVPAATASIQFTPTVSDETASVKVNGTGVASGAASDGIALDYGDTAVRIVVTAGDNVTTRAYAITVRRALPGNALAASFSAATDVPLTVAGLKAAGNTVSLGLNFAPATGTTLMVVKNTGTDLIKGVFTNLLQGQKVKLAFGGKFYDFVANYYGGSGNDLVLQWASTRLMAWGTNAKGTVGDNTEVDRLVPVPVNGMLTDWIVTAVAAGSTHTLALCSDGTLFTWGSNSIGQLGNNYLVQSSTPLGGVNNRGALVGKKPVAIAVGNIHNLVLCSDGTLVAWGGNSQGQLGNDSQGDTDVPVAVVANGVLRGRTVVAIAAAGSNSLALCSDGTVAAWGSNANFQLGSSGSTNTIGIEPMAVSATGALAGKFVTAIAAGAYHGMALCSDGTVATWGGNYFGTLGNNGPTTQNTFVPVAVDISGVLAGKTVTNIAAGGTHNLVLCADGTLAAWGTNGGGQLGNNSNMQSPVPVAVVGTGVLAGKTPVSITAGGAHSLALCSDGTLTAWGINSGGQLGINSTTQSRVPVVVSTSAFIAGDRFTAAASSPAASNSFALVASGSPVIAVKGNNLPISADDTTPDAADGTDFGSVALFGTQAVRTFTIANEGGGVLNRAQHDVAITGDGAADFKITAQPQFPVVAGSSTSFAITFDPSLPGQRTATVVINSSDSATPYFTFRITGLGSLPVKLAQTITFAPPATLYHPGQSPFALSATSSSGLPVTFSLVSGSGFASLAGNALTLTGTGVLKVQATAPGNDRYNAATALVRTITVKTTPTVLTLVNLSQAYDGQPKPIATLGTAEAPAITYKVGTSYVPQAPALAGSYLVKAVAGTKIVTGTLIIAKAPLYVTPDDKHRYAGQANPTLTVAYSGFVNGETSAMLIKSPALATSATAASIGGTYPITASGATALNYSFIYRQGIMVVDTYDGTYEFLLVDQLSQPVAKLTVIVAATSKTFTAKLATATEAAAVSFTGPLVTGSDRATGTVTTDFPKLGTAYSIEFILPAYGSANATALQGGATFGTSSDGQKISTKPVLFAGAHTAVLEPATPAAAGVPAGAGWATASASTTGVLTLAGKLGDGTAFTTTLNPDGLGDPGYRLFVQPYLVARKQSFLAGAFNLAPHPVLPNRRYLAQQPMTWKKTGLPADASYRGGFDPVSTVLMIDPWLPPTAATKTIPAISLAQRLGLSGSSISFGVSHSATGSNAQPSLPTRLGLSAANAVSVLAPATVPVNKTKWKTLTFVPTTGTFTGSFELVDGTLKRPVSFSGVLRQPASNADPLIGDGHYLLPPVSGTEKTTGEILFTRP